MTSDPIDAATKAHYLSLARAVLRARDEGRAEQAAESRCRLLAAVVERQGREWAEGVVRHYLVLAGTEE